MTQEQMVIDYMTEYGSITTLDAFKDLGITRLSAKIFNLKKAGYEIQKTAETGKNRWGKPIYYARYSIKEQEA